ncbi:FKBP-type peptidyl-prolyl cis-trans isomerase [Bdellovibrio sp. HCB209]|uniref:FKBP-type peptidyl-prolyl cis-trans isomerase n=1 Tax=Bdellovibrio sp. HCB209 TaxID=3394354 RepID=UPI0039B62D79
MNKLVLGGLVVAVAATTACTKKVKLDTDIKKASYAIGQQIGGNLKQQNIDFDSDALAQALKDASAGKNEMTKEDMQAAMMKLQELAMKKQQEAADTNSKAGKDYLEKNKTAAGVKTTASGLQYIIEKEGTGAMPKKEDVVKVHYKGTLTNGEQFDSSYERGQPAEFPVGGVIPGWTEALQLMKVGSKAKLFIPPELAYGPSGRPGIPPNSVLVFEVELMDIVKAEKPAAKAKK